MFLPAEYTWLEPAIVAAVAVFLIDLIGNSIAYSGRLINAIVTAIVFFIVFGALSYFGIGKMEVSTTVGTIPSGYLPEDFIWLEPVLLATLVVFIVGFIGNVMAFKNRFMNALVTAILFVLIFGALTYFGYGAVSVELPVAPVGEMVSPE